MKQILIIGGGISGLAVLHNLKKKYANQADIQVRLFEKNDYTGGTAHSCRYAHCLFEQGPNGFLDSKASTVALAKDLGLEEQLLYADDNAKLRFISVKNKLHALPSSPLAFVRFEPFSFFDKLKVLGEFFVAPGKKPEESVYEFGSRRLGEKFAKLILDPMVSGVFGGDAKNLNLKEAFPRIYEIEQTHGSLIKGMLRLKKQKGMGQPGGRLVSFKQGMSQLSEKIFERYAGSIQPSTEVRAIRKIGEGFVVETDQTQYFAQEIFLCTPAPVAAGLLKDINRNLSQALAKINYASIAVVGLVYKRSAFAKIPAGFGYLIPSSEGKEVLGVLFCSNIFDGRTDAEHFLFRVMLGGARHPDSIKKTEAELLSLAEDEVRVMLGPNSPPVDRLIKVWPKGIPQYDLAYASLKKQILNELCTLPDLHLVANYLDGISLNDCTANAHTKLL